MFNYILLGSKADEVPFTVHAFVLGGYYQSPGYFTPQGIHRLLDNFKREMSCMGIHLFVNAEVIQILTDQNRSATGVKIQNGNVFTAPLIIASFNPKLLNQILNSGTLRPIFRERLVEAEDTFGLYVAFYKLEANQDIVIENLIYYNHSLDIALGAMPNCSENNQTLSVFLADPDPVIPADPHARELRAREKLKLIENVVTKNYPALNDKLTLLDYLKPWSFERYTKMVNGSAYGIKQTINSIGFQHKVPVRGLYLVGQAIYPGFLGSLISGFSLANEVFGVNEFWPKVTKQWN